MWEENDYNDSLLKYKHLPTFYTLDESFGCVFIVVGCHYSVCRMYIDPKNFTGKVCVFVSDMTRVLMFIVK